MSQYVDLSEKVTATFYDQEHEEWTQQTVTVADVLDSVCDDYTVLPSAQSEGKMSNKEWIDFLVCQFDISRTSAKEMLHGMMQWKKEDNFKKQFSGRRVVKKNDDIG